MSVGTAPSATHDLRQLLASSRPLSWVNTAYPFAAAYSLATRQIDITLVLGTVYFLVPYNLLMYGVNDVCDHESDLRNPRKGGVEGIVLDAGLHRLTVWAAVLSNLPFLVALVWLGDPTSTTTLALSVAAVVAYSAPRLRFKEVPVLDSLTSSTHFVSPAWVGLALADAPLTGTVVLALAAFFLWGIASHAFGAVQDISADRAAGMSSVATVFGAAGTVRLAAGCYGLAGLLLIATSWPVPLAAVVVLPYLANVAPYLRLDDADCERAHDGWRRFLLLNYVAGFLVTQLLIWIVMHP